MKKRNLLVFALCAAAAIGAGAVNTIDVEAKTITCAQDASQVTYGTLTDSQKEMVAKYFNAEYYASQYFDVVQAVGNDREALLKHFCDCGIWEGRHGWAEFDVSAYASAYNLKEAYGKDIAKYYEDYFTVGVAEGRYLTTVELCEANGIKVESLFGEYKFLDANIYKAASLMGTTDYSAVAQAVSVATETQGPVVVQVPDANGGEPTEYVVTNTTNPIMEKCKGLTPVYVDIESGFYVWVIETKTGGLNVYNVLTEVHGSQSPKDSDFDTHYYEAVMKDKPEGLKLVYSSDGNEDVYEYRDIAYLYNESKDDNLNISIEVGDVDNFYHSLGISSFESTVPNYEFREDYVGWPFIILKGYQIPEADISDEKIEYSQGIGVEPLGDGSYIITYGVYNEEAGFAADAEYAITKREKSSPLPWEGDEDATKWDAYSYYYEYHQAQLDNSNNNNNNDNNDNSSNNN